MPLPNTIEEINLRITELLKKLGISERTIHELQRNSFPQGMIDKLLRTTSIPAGLKPGKVRIIKAALESTLNLLREKEAAVPCLTMSSDSPSGFTPTPRSLERQRLRDLQNKKFKERENKQTVLTAEPSALTCTESSTTNRSPSVHTERTTSSLSTPPARPAHRQPQHLKKSR